MKILIADDEPLVRIGIKSSYDWKQAGMEIVGEAADGEETLRLLEQLKPDVLLLDIKMPQKDGIDVLTEMRQRGMTAKVVILSSFDDFVHVKKAMKLGAADYFHKPSMDVLEIVDVLRKIKNQIEEGRTADTGASGTAALNRETILRDLIGGRTENASSTRLTENNLYAVVFSVKKYAHTLKRYSGESAAFLQGTILNLLGELLSKEPETEYVRLQDNLFAILASHAESKSVQAAFARVNDLVYLVHSSLKRYVNIDTVFGISEPCHAFSSLRQAVDQARQALELKFYHPNEPLFYYRSRNLDDESMQAKVQALIAAMKTGLKEEKYEEFATSLAEWEEFVRSRECMTENDVKKVYEGLLFMLADDEDYGESRAGADELDDFTECSGYYHARFNEMLKARISGKSKDYSPLIRNIVQYLETHYREDISLALLGDTFHASPNYISRLFKQEVGRGLFDYLNHVRIRKAKELLKDYKYKIYEIAELVGFHSQVHFAIVFNKYEGMSPTDFRKELG
ncbi:response regulator [Cohnella thermotolerans]|uniref:response regulator n=1 Tax=Cohnella thermotolerans TaxID=329858 RepID=UPI00040EBCD5|nr:response regulator [Cohnella thermotolerans]